MKKRVTLAIIAGIALTAGAWTYGRSAPAAQRGTPAPQTWEYLFQTGCTQAQANGLGAVGWELVAMDPTSSHRQCIYKRPKQ
jgi:hypothetical protein